MNNDAPIKIAPGSDWHPSWVNWFKQVFNALGGWNRSLGFTHTVDFGAVPAGAQLSAAVVITGALQGDAVIVTPLFDTAGLAYTGVVTAKNTVTIYAKNFTTGAINPPSTAFRVIVLQG